jgi:hypothetical protein
MKLLISVICMASCATCLATCGGGGGPSAEVAGAVSMTYVYRGNNFVEIQGELGIFSTNDRVTGQFTVDCSAAHIAGTCANLAFDDYFTLGAVNLEPLWFSAGPARLPTADGRVEIAIVSFSTDSNGHIVDWNIDLFLIDPSGVINVDTDNDIRGPIDTAVVLGGEAQVLGNPGEWTVVRHLAVAIVIKPGNKSNVVNPRSRGEIWVALLSDTDAASPFDPASQVDIPTVEFGPDGATANRYKVIDINTDGLGDLLLRFKIPETGIACGDTETTLAGEAFSGQAITGSNAITTLGCP